MLKDIDHFLAEEDLGLDEVDLLAERMQTCPRCGAPWQTTLAMNEGPSEFWKECSNPKCNTYLNTYMPQAHQFEFHEDGHRFKANFGGYGSGKTLTSRQEIYKHIFLTPNGTGVIGANVSSQYEQTIKREIEADIPKAFIAKVSTQKNYYEFKNGYRLLFRPFDDPDKLRSYNVDLFVILEASEVKQASFTQLKTRLRNKAAMLQKKDEDGALLFRKAKNGAKIPVIEQEWLEGIIESNPDAGWIRDEVLLNSEEIYKHGDVLDEIHIEESRRDPMISTHITATSANEFLPADFIEQNTKNKPLWWVNRFIYGSFLYAEGLVYPNYAKCFVDDYDIPPQWKRVIAFDYGLVDPSVFLFCAVDMEHNKAVIYKEVRINDKNVEELAMLFHHECRDIPMGGMWIPPIIDPKSGPKRDYEKKSLADHFLDYGIAFQPGTVNVEARMFRLNTYIESGKLEIFNSCVDLREELSKYRFQKDSGAEFGFTNKPIDKNNHAINALEWITMELPSDPQNLINGVYAKTGNRLDTASASDEDKVAFYALTDDEDLEYNTLVKETPFEITEWY